MKKSARKLVVRRETLRALIRIDLEGVVGGDAVYQSGDKSCAIQGVAGDSGLKTCTGH